MFFIKGCSTDFTELRGKSNVFTLKYLAFHLIYKETKRIWKKGHSALDCLLRIYIQAMSHLRNLICVMINMPIEPALEEYRKVQKL